MVNRIREFMHAAGCPHCDRRKELEEKHALAVLAASDIERAAEVGAFEFWVPSVERLLDTQANDDDDGPAGVAIVLHGDDRWCDLDGDLRAFAVEWCRATAAKLLEAAENIEASGIGGGA